MSRTNRSESFTRWLRGLAIGALVAGCSSSPSGDALISGSVTLGYAGQPYAMMYGIAIDHAGSLLIGFGSEPIDCDSPSDQNPPTGTSAVVTMTSLAPASYSNLAVELIHNTGDLDINGSNTGQVTITAASDASVAGSVTFANTDNDGTTYNLDGTFEVDHCP